MKTDSVVSAIELESRRALRVLRDSHFAFMREMYGDAEPLILAESMSDPAMPGWRYLIAEDRVERVAVGSREAAPPHKDSTP